MLRRAGLFAGVALLVLAGAPARADDLDAGRAVFARCKVCHRVGEGAKNSVGPELNGLTGRKAASLAEYPYSEALKASGLTWDEATLDEYLTAPGVMVPGTKMAFAGLRKPEERAALIRWLGQFNPDGTVKTP